jgi:hypothetical protein
LAIALPTANPKNIGLAFAGERESDFRGAHKEPMRDRDCSSTISQSASMIPDRLRSPEPPRAARSSETPIAPPPGVDHCDRIAEAFARRDLAVTMQQKLEVEWIEKLLDRRNPHKAKPRTTLTRGKEWGSKTTNSAQAPATVDRHALLDRIEVLRAHIRDEVGMAAMAAEPTKILLEADIGFARRP